MNTAMRNPLTQLPLPATPDKLNQPEVMWTECAWSLSTQISPAIDSPTRIRYSTAAIPTCVRAVIRMPTMAMTSMSTPTAQPMATYVQVLVDMEPNTASTEGPSRSTSATVPMM